MTDPIYALRPSHHVGEGWWKLAWRPIWRSTYSLYWDDVFHWSSFGLRVHTFRMDARNGWHRSYKHAMVRVSLLWWTLNIWVKWGFVVHQEGPSDTPDRRPLDLSGIRGPRTTTHKEQ